MFKLSIDKHQYSMERETPTELLGQHCIDHSEEVTYFCKTHLAPICESCVDINHAHCPTETVADITVNFNRKLQKFKRIHLDVEEHEGDLRYALEKVKSHLKLAKKKIKNTFQEIRSKVDEREHELLKELDNLGDEKISSISTGCDEYLKLKESIENIIVRGEKLLNQRVESKESTRGATQCDEEGTGIRAVVTNVVRHEELLNFSERQNKEEVTEIENCLKELKNLHECEIGETLVAKDEGVVTQLFDALDKIITVNVQKQADQNQNVKTETNPPSFNYPLPVLDPRPLPRLKQRPVKKFSLDRQLYPRAVARCIKFIPNGNGSFLVASEKPNQLKRFNSKGREDKHILLSSEPHDLCFYKNDLLAITFPFEKSINIYNSKHLTKRSEIAVPWRCFGICRLEDTDSFVVSCTHVVRNITEGISILSKSKPIFKFPAYITLSGCNQYIFVSDEENDEVVILSKDSLLKLNVFTHSYLRGPGDLCVSDTGSIYVCSLGDRRIVEISSNGEYISTILSEEQQLVEYPSTVSYHAGNKTLIVANWKDDLIQSVIQIFKEQ